MCSFLLFRYNAILPLGRLLLYLGIAVLPLLDPERPETSKVSQSDGAIYCNRVIP
jgi:hypothetical protein